MPNSSHLDALVRLLSPKRKIFVSYHHGGDRRYYEAFAAAVADEMDAVEDRSVDRVIDSDDADYVIRTIRENYITGTSCTVVLCGASTPWRKFVDWEIKATLDAAHGLLGVILPTNPGTMNGTFTVPDRLRDNIVSGYALLYGWASLVSDAAVIKTAIATANAKPSWLICNSRGLRRKNG